MLGELHISDLGVIDDLDLDLDPGLNVLTGETGAGKTMITVGLALALGQRGAGALVRPGARAAKIQARFDGKLPSSASEWSEDDELVLARSIAADGKSSVRIGGQIATVGALVAIGPELVEVHGQHAAQGLLEPSAQARFLDRFAGPAHIAAVDGLRDAHRRSSGLRARIRELSDLARDRERELDLLSYQIREIEQAAPVPGELEVLEREERRLENAERIASLASSAGRRLADEGAGADALRDAAAALMQAATMDESIAPLADRAASVAEEATDLARAAREHAERAQLDPRRLEEIRERLRILRDLFRKYGEGEAEVLSFLERARDRAAEIEGADDERASLQAEADELDRSLAGAAAAVSEGRASAAPRLAAAVEAEVHELGMAGSRVRVALEPLDELGAGGAERVALRLCAGPGQAELPLARTASGGELSRVMLACRSGQADLDEVPTLVFDEVDAGIGGRAGVAVGRRLARLASTRQVLVVTHLPQIASFADRHIRVQKSHGIATASVLRDDERIDELSRMLSGLPGSQTAAVHAEEMLAEAHREKAT